MTTNLHEDEFDVSVAPYSQSTPPAQFGSEVSAMPPRQDMYEIDTLAGGPIQDRTGNPADFTGGDLEKGLGGNANPDINNGTMVDGVPRGLPLGL